MVQTLVVFADDATIAKTKTAEIFSSLARAVLCGTVAKIRTAKASSGALVSHASPS